jgi:hypothetical protein
VNGGGVTVSNAVVTLRDVDFVDSVATSGGSAAYGGAIFSSPSAGLTVLRATFVDCVVASRTSPTAAVLLANSFGAAVFARNGVANLTSLSITRGSGLAFYFETLSRVTLRDSSLSSFNGSSLRMFNVTAALVEDMRVVNSTSPLAMMIVNQTMASTLAAPRVDFVRVSLVDAVSPWSLLVDRRSGPTVVANSTFLRSAPLIYGISGDVIVTGTSVTSVDTSLTTGVAAVTIRGIGAAHRIEGSTFENNSVGDVALSPFPGSTGRTSLSVVDSVFRGLTRIAPGARLPSASVVVDARAGPVTLAVTRSQWSSSVNGSLHVLGGATVTVESSSFTSVRSRALDCGMSLLCPADCMCVLDVVSVLGETSCRASVGRADGRGDGLHVCRQFGACCRPLADKLTCDCDVVRLQRHGRTGAADGHGADRHCVEVR